MFFWRSTYSLHRTSMRPSSISPFFFHVNPPVVFRCMTNCCYLLSSQAAGNHLEAPTSPGWPPLSPAGSFQADYRDFQCPNQICEVPTASNYVCMYIYMYIIQILLQKVTRQPHSRPSRLTWSTCPSCTVKGKMGPTKNRHRALVRTTSFSSKRTCEWLTCSKA